MNYLRDMAISKATGLNRETVKAIRKSELLNSIHTLFKNKKF